MIARTTESRQDQIASFRLMAMTFGGDEILVRISKSSIDSIQLARRLAIRLAQASRSRAGRIARLYVEKWVGSASCGSWERLTDRDASVRVQYRPTAVEAIEDTSVLPPQSGEVIECELLSEKTRAGGWRAKIVGCDAVGPVVNSHEVPSHFSAGAHIRLKVYGIKLDRGFAQFAWK